MDNLRIIAETDTYVWAQEKDDLRAMAIIHMLGACTRLYGQEPMFLFFDRMRCAVETRQYGVLYERREKDALVAVPVAVMTWAKLSRPNAAVLEARLRPLSKDEWKSGSQLWAINLVAAYADTHGKVAREFFSRQFSASHREYYALEGKPSELRKKIYKLGEGSTDG